MKKNYVDIAKKLMKIVIVLNYIIKMTKTRESKEVKRLKEQIRAICADSDYKPTEKVNLIYNKVI